MDNVDSQTTTESSMCLIELSPGQEQRRYSCAYIKYLALRLEWILCPVRSIHQHSPRTNRIAYWLGHKKTAPYSVRVSNFWGAAQFKDF